MDLAGGVLEAHARIRDAVERTPLVRAGRLSELAGAEAWLKYEHLQRTGSFKLRGATNKLRSVPSETLSSGVVTASNGNHALAVAAAAAALQVPVEVFVSDRIADDRRERIAAFGAQVRTVAGDPLLAELAARAAAERSGRTYVSPYNDVDVVAGQGTVAVEMFEERPDLDAIYVAVGGGGLIGGIGSYAKAAAPNAAIVAALPRRNAAMYESVRAGKVVEVPDLPTLSTSTAGNLEPGCVTLAICRDAIDDFVLVEEDEILAALRFLYREEGLLVEGAAGVAVAAFLKDRERRQGRRAGIVLCGGNVDPELASAIMR